MNEDDDNEISRYTEDRERKRLYKEDNTLEIVTDGREKLMQTSNTRAKNIVKSELKLSSFLQTIIHLYIYLSVFPPVRSQVF